MQFKQAQRLQQLPPYVFVEIDRLKSEAIERGEDVINLGIGDPDQPTPGIIIEALAEAARDQKNHRYPMGIGTKGFRQAVADYYMRTRNVSLDPDSEITCLIGSKEGIGHLPLACVNPGDVVMIPEPGYPVYYSGTVFAGGEPYTLPLLAENGFLPDLDAVPSSVFKRTRLMFLNYPNNPTAALATRAFFEKAISLAKKHNFVIAHDAAYLDMTYSRESAVSFMEMQDSKDVGIEIHSLSKSFNMTGWRVAYAVGNPEVIKALAKLKSNLDSGVFTAIQRAAIVALDNYENLITDVLDTYRSRISAFSHCMDRLGWQNYSEPKGTFYVWLKTRNSLSSMEMVKTLIQRCAIVTTPGTGFGSLGEGYFRFALTTAEERIEEACNRIAKAGL